VFVEFRSFSAENVTRELARNYRGK
jgi:hypothetical protein